MSTKEGTQTVGRRESSELVLTRLIDAPRERVWRAWTEPEQVKRWHGPKGFTAQFCEIDLRVGGTYLNGMRSPDGKEDWSAGVYREIVPAERLVFTRANGAVVPAEHHERGADVPLEVLTVTLEDFGAKTRMTVRRAGLPPGLDGGNTDLGWNGALDKLAASMEAGAGSRRDGG